MDKIWNALRYGDSHTRKCVGSVILFIVIALVLIIVSAITGKFVLFMLGMLCGVVALIISQSFTLVDEKFVAEVDRKGTKDTVSAGIAKKKSLGEADANDDEEKDNAFSIDDRERRKEEKKLQESIAQFGHYNQQVLKKVKRKYHVRKDHRPILIDNSKTYHIKECPAFIWRVHNKVYILLLEKEPRRICVSRDMISHLEYVPKVRADKLQEYQEFKKDNLITSVFEGFIPDYFDFKDKNTKLKYKNLYGIYPDIQISNRSASQVMDLLYLNFMPKDKITESEKVNGYFKRVYSANILYKDRVYSITEYKDQVELILQEMCSAEMPAQEFYITLENLVNARFISQEYADHYTDVRNKLGRKTVSVTYSR